MKTRLKLITLAVTAITFAACGSGSKTPGTDSVHIETIADGITICNGMNGIAVIGIQDREGEQAVDLFRGSYNDSLLDSLLAPGQTAFRSAFNVYIARGNAGNSNDINHTILFDAGIGPQAGGQLLMRLSEQGIEPTDIEAVCLTHLHFDHLGWLLDSAGNVTFPNATLYLSKEEMASSKDNERWQQVLTAYGEHVTTFSDGDTICYGMVTTMVVPGHTPGHTLYEVGPCLIVGDLLHAQDLQLEHPDFCARYDADPARAVQVRKGILQKCDRLLCGAHCYDLFISISSDSHE